MGGLVPIPEDVERGRFGIRDGTIVHISELGPAHRGLKCRCTCPSCGDQLQAKLGDVRVHHFSHSPGRECTGNRESALHALSKEVFARNDRFMMPEARVWLGSDSLRVASACYVHYGDVQAEYSVAGIRADIALERADSSKLPFLIEVAVTHFVDEEKHDKLRQLDYPCIEIDLSTAGLDFHEFDRAELERLLIHEVNNRTWIRIPGEERYLEELEAAAAERNRKAEAEAQRKAAWAERKRKERAMRVDHILSQEYQAEARARRNAAFGEHPTWAWVRRQLGLRDDNIPYYLNHKVGSEFLFTCHRTIWQSLVFLSWVHNKKRPGREPDIPVWYVADNLLERNPELIERDLIYSSKEVYRGPRPAEPITEYLEFLEQVGFVEKTWEGRKGAAVFVCIRPGVVLLPREYNDPRYVLREPGCVRDRETGESIKLQEKDMA